MFEPVYETTPDAVIKVVGVGGGGGNALNHMVRSCQEDDIGSVEFFSVNTDAQVLRSSAVRNTVQIGAGITHGLGAGGDPNIGYQSAEEDREALTNMLSDASMVFIAAGMGGGSGTGASPVIAEIAKEMFSYCDGFTASLKKDGHANMGGILAFRDKGYFWKKFSDFNEDGSVKTDVGILLKVKQISSYGNDSYGSMSGRDIMALAAGLYECCNFNYLQERVEQCNYLAEGFYKAGVKGVVLPAGGHGVYINMDEFFDGKRGHETFAGEGFSIELIRRYGIRVSELGDYSMEYDLKTPEQQAEVANVVRFAINRSVYSQEHLDYVIAAVKALYEDRESIPNMRIVSGHNLPMRHFHAFLEPYPNEEK